MDAAQGPYARFDALYQALLGRLSRGGRKVEDHEAAELYGYWEAAERDWSCQPRDTTIFLARPRPWELVAVDLDLPRDPVAANPAPNRAGRKAEPLTPYQDRLLDDLLDDPALSDHEIGRRVGITHQRVARERKKRSRR